MKKKNYSRLDFIKSSKNLFSRRDFLKLAGVAAGAAVLTAVDPPEVMAKPLPAYAPEPITLDVWWSNDIADLDAPWISDPYDPNFWVEWWWGGLARAAFNPWRAQHPGVSLKITAHDWADPLRTNQLLALASGNIPDTTYGESFVSEFARMGIYQPVSKESAKLFPKCTIAEAKLGGNYYGVPQSSGTNTLMVNLDVLERCGLPTDPNHLPTTWDQLLSDAQKVSQANMVGFPFPEFWGPPEWWGGIEDWSNNAFFSYPPPGNYGNAMRVLPWFSQNRAPLADEEGNPTANTKRAVDTWTWHNAMMATSNSALHTNFVVWYGEFASAALFHYGVTAYKLGWSGDMMYEGNPGYNFGEDKYTNAVALPLPLPPGGKPANIVIGNQINSALKYGPHPDLALSLIEEVWTREDVQAWLPQHAGIWVPALKSLLGQWKTYNQLDAYTTEAAKAMARVSMHELLNDGVDSLPRWPNNTTKCWEDWNNAYQAIWGGNLSPDEIKAELDALQINLLADISASQE